MQPLRVFNFEQTRPVNRHRIPGIQHPGDAMGTVHLIDRSFGPEAIHAMGAAFDSAWQDLEASGNIFSSRFTADWARKRIATRIITRVLGGERDPGHLSDDALAHLAHALPANQA